MNKIKSITKSFVEQGISSLGNFLFFFMLARCLKPERFGQFSAIWISIQVMTSIAGALVYLPVTSMSISKEAEPAFYGVCLQKLMKFFLLVPILLFVVLFFASGETINFPLMLIAIIVLCIVVMTVDFLRFYLIRTGHKMAAALLVITRWTVPISLVLMSYITDILSVENSFLCMLIGNFLALTITIFTINYLRCNINLSKDKQLKTALTIFSKPLLLQALGSSASSVIVAFAMRSWISIAAFGAYKALRSICNIVSPLMQMINTHYSSYLAVISDFRHHRLTEHIMYAGGGLLVLLSWFFKEPIIENTIGPSYLAYSFLLPVIMFHTVIMLLNNLLAAGIRRSGKTRIFNYYAIISILSGILIIPAAKYYGSVQIAVYIITLASVIQFILLKTVSTRVLEGTNNDKYQTYYLKQLQRQS